MHNRENSLWHRFLQLGLLLGNHRSRLRRALYHHYRTQKCEALYLPVFMHDHTSCAFGMRLCSRHRFVFVGTPTFIARRCTSEAIYSHNGTNFTAAERELQLSINRWKQQSLPSKLAQRGIRWHFNLPTASHQGGSWERIIRSVKRTLAAVSGAATMSDETFTTFLIEVERILNDRLITKIASHSRDPEALTPNALLKGHLEPFLPMGVFAKTDGYRKSWSSLVCWLIVSGVAGSRNTFLCCSRDKSGLWKAEIFKSVTLSW